MNDWTTAEPQMLINDPMTDDDFIHACHWLQGEAEGAAHGGHFASHLGAAYEHIAQAYYHADLTNQRAMRRNFEPLFRYAWNMWRLTH